MLYQVKAYIKGTGELCQEWTLPPTLHEDTAYNDYQQLKVTLAETHDIELAETA